MHALSPWVGLDSLFVLFCWFLLRECQSRKCALRLCSFTFSLLDIVFFVFSVSKLVVLFLKLFLHFALCTMFGMAQLTRVSYLVGNDMTLSELVPLKVHGYWFCLPHVRMFYFFFNIAFWTCRTRELWKLISNSQFLDRLHDWKVSNHTCFI